MKNNTSFRLTSKTGPILMFLLSFSLLFLGFYRNQWQMARPKKFSAFQKDVESYVIARLVLTRQSRILASGGLLGWGDVNPEDVNEADYQHQYDVYFNNLSFETYLAKESHPGFQGILFSILDRSSPFTPAVNLRLFRMFTAGLFAMILAGIIIWFRQELGWLAALFVLFSILASQWMTLFGRNLFFVSGFFYLPMLVLLLRLKSEKSGTPITNRQLFWLTFSLILLKCLFNGYDFILPTLGMAASPIMFYGAAGGWGRVKFVKRFLTVVTAALMAILVSLAVLSFQISYTAGGLAHGFNSILETIDRRTISSDASLPSIYETAARASYWSILKIYLSESYFDRLPVPYFVIILAFTVVTILYWISIKTRGVFTQGDGGVALSAVTWFSLLSPLSWYIIFKSVAYFHTHMNYLPWHMPFTLFGFGLCGYVIETTFRQFRIKRSMGASRPTNRRSPLHGDDAG